MRGGRLAGLVGIAFGVSCGHLRPVRTVMVPAGHEGYLIIFFEIPDAPPLDLAPDARIVMPPGGVLLTSSPFCSVHFAETGLAFADAADPAAGPWDVRREVLGPDGSRAYAAGVPLGCQGGPWPDGRTTAGYVDRRDSPYHMAPRDPPRPWYETIHLRERELLPWRACPP